MSVSVDAPATRHGGNPGAAEVRKEGGGGGVVEANAVGPGAACKHAHRNVWLHVQWQHLQCSCGCNNDQGAHWLKHVDIPWWW